MSELRSVKKIVIVEDNPALSDVYKTRLEILGYTCFAAYDGVQALAVIEREIPDLVLLDLMVPKIAGDQVLERMRGSDWGKHIKVMIISNLNEADAPAGLRNLGIEGYAVKANLSNDQLDQLVDVILRPAGQVEDVVLNHENVPELQHADHVNNEPNIPAANNPLSGTSLANQPPDASLVSDDAQHTPPPASDQYPSSYNQ
jgi:DNA-binding response OmpR family regulator